jgi:hypothetical protein
MGVISYFEAYLSMLQAVQARGRDPDRREWASQCPHAFACSCVLCVLTQLDDMVKDQLHKEGRASSSLQSTVPTNKQLHEGATRSFYLLSCHVSSTACRCVEYREIKQREVVFLGQLTQRTAPLRVRIHRSALPSEQVLFLRIFEEGANKAVTHKSHYYTVTLALSRHPTFTLSARPWRCPLWAWASESAFVSG